METRLYHFVLTTKITMAKMHSRKRGRSSSKNPLKTIPKGWNVHGSKEAEQLVIKLAKTGKRESIIGLILRDNYGIPSVKAITKKSIGNILHEHKIETKLPDDLHFLIMKDIRLMKHVEHHKKDMSVKRGSQLTFSKIKRLSSYSIKTSQLPSDWKYDRTKAKLLIE